MELIQTNNSYRVNVDAFEGPLDLLHHLIKKNDIDIYDIPIAFVLEEYMKYIDTIKDLDIDLAGEFLLMAAELAHIKSRMLLPEDSPLAEDDEGADPRAELVKRLLEYQQFKEASEKMYNRQMLGRDVFKQLSPERIQETKDGPIEGNVYDLVQAFSELLKRVPAERMHEVAVDRISLNDRIYQIMSIVKKDVTTTLDSLLPRDVTRYDIVITFIALLEMGRLKMIKIFQMELAGKIYLQGLMTEVSDEEMARLIEIEAKGFEKPEA